MKLNLRKIKGIGRKNWGAEKQKAAVFLKISEKLGGKAILHQFMKKDWYRHIDKAIEGKVGPRDAKNWKKMRRRFKKNIVGEPNQETLNLLEWLKEFEQILKTGQPRPIDYDIWLPKFKSYMKSCEEGGIDNYIVANKLMED